MQIQLGSVFFFFFLLVIFFVSVHFHNSRKNVDFLAVDSYSEFYRTFKINKHTHHIRQNCTAVMPDLLTPNREDAYFSRLAKSNCCIGIKLMAGNALLLQKQAGVPPGEG